ncbi:hypothetical protein LQZ39_25300, partial [Enterobacter cloacae complex sp. RIVM_C039474]|uniref:hypothetical protein n=1 Tax=Enterobacter cloacae complex sp. RIVM_C039474 TaxID=2900327 RepID=UPI002340F49C
VSWQHHRFLGKPVPKGQRHGSYFRSALTNSNSIKTDNRELESAPIVSHDFFITFMVHFFTHNTAS